MGVFFINLELEVHNLKRASLNFELFESFSFSPHHYSYVGGIPYDTTSHHCSSCHAKLDFVFQFFIPSISSEIDNKLYSFFYCNHCRPLSGNIGFHMSVITNPDFNSSPYDIALRSSLKYAFFDFKFKWQTPDWDYIHLISTSTKKKFTEHYSETAEEQYCLESEHACGRELDDSFNFIGGFPKFLDLPVIPYCNSECRERFDLFIQLDSHPKLDLKWHDSGCLYIFKCPKEDNFKFFIQ